MSGLGRAGGSRRAVRQPTQRRGAGSALAGATMAAVAIGAVLVVGPGDDRTTTRPGADAVGSPVTELLRGCPGRVASGSRARTLLTSTAEGGENGRVSVGPVDGDLAPIGIGGGEQSTVSGSSVAGPLRIRAEGALAAGLATHRMDTVRATSAAVECEAPASSWWFVGGGGTLEHGSTLVLVNLDPGAAVLDVQVLDGDGPVETVGTRGITVQPGTRTTLDLSEIAPQADELSVQVDVTRGRVLAAMSDSFSRRLGDSAGFEWIPAAHLARRSLRLAGLPSRAAARSLLIANPAERETLVDVEVAGESGSFAPTENPQVRVPPESVVAVDLTESIGRDGAVVRLRSEVPVVATVRSTAEGDTTYAASVRPLAGAAAAPLVPGASLALGAGRSPARATVASYDRNGARVETRDIEIVADGTSRWTPGKAADYVVVAPARGHVHGAVTFTGRSGATQLPLTTLDTTTRKPSVRPGLR